MATGKGIPILISLDAQTTADGRPEDGVRLITTGEMFENPGETLIRYEESLDEEEPPQKIELIIRKDVITLSRSGKYDANMVFQKGRRYESQYRTPYGNLDMALYCTRANVVRAGNGGEISLQYQLDLGGQYAAMHDMKLHWMRKKAP
jgi:uncharacterized beta-barrel protein YwiB (DUF1934 family)